MTRLFARADLEELARPPDERLRRALEAGEHDDALQVWRSGLRSYRGFALGTRQWIAAIHGFVAESYGIEALAPMLAESDIAHALQQHGVQPEDLDGWAEDREPGPEALLAQGDPGALRQRFDEEVARLRRVHDFYRDWVTALLSHFYRARGVAALEACLRDSGERTLLRWMPRDLARPVAERVRSWAGMCHGNFSRFRIEEDDEKFSFIQDPCGSCGRQIQGGAYEGSKGFCVVGEKHPLTYGEGDTPIYRSHVAVMHYLLPIEQNGVPWPLVHCPGGMEVGPCHIVLYKDPRETPAHFADRVRSG